jgi:hypothetical protein
LEAILKAERRTAPDASIIRGLCRWSLRLDPSKAPENPARLLWGLIDGDISEQDDVATQHVLSVNGAPLASSARR